MVQAGALTSSIAGASSAGAGGFATASQGVGLGLSSMDVIGGQIGAILNYTNQQKQQAYNRDMQQQIFEREDNAVQRRVRDLKLAGLSPVLAAGQPAQAGNVVQTEAPQFNQKVIDPMVMTALARGQVDIERTKSENELLKNNSLKSRMEALKIAQDQNTSRAEEILKYKQSGLTDEQIKTQTENTRKLSNANLLKESTGILSENPSLMSDTVMNAAGYLSKLRSFLPDRKKIIRFPALGDK
ncbi:MAG: DNA pilot protein [Arizlama microvirus]|nr:MAG: DNA pilot protein [Arizlama microvirus]